MMKKLAKHGLKLSVVYAFVFAIFDHNAAFAQMNLSLVGGMVIPSEKVSTTPATSAGEGQAVLGFGTLVGFKKNKFGFETGAIYMPYRMKSISANSEITTNYLTIPVLLRWIPSQYVSIGAGVSYAVRQGASSVKNLTTFAVTDKTSNDLNANLSATGSLAFVLPLTPKAGILLDFRYLLGMSNLFSQPAASGDELKYSAILGLAGLRFVF